MASSPAITSIISSSSVSEMLATAPTRFGSSSSSSPSVARILIASRSGVREMPKRSVSSPSLMRALGSISPERISSRIRSATSSWR